MINIPIAYCINGYEASTICAVDSCRSCAFICSHPNCTCKATHSNCLSISSYSSIVNKVLQKSFQFGDCFNKIQNWYEETVNKLLDEREGLLKKRQRINLQGLEEKEKELLKLLNTGEFNKISGSFVFDIVKILKNTPKPNILGFNKKIEEEIKSVKLNLDYIRQLWDEQSKQRKILQDCCWQVIEGQTELTVSSNFNLASITYLGLTKFDSETIKMLGSSCYSLSQLYILDQPSSPSIFSSLPQHKFDKYVIENLGKHLKKRLKKLAIKSPILTMKEVAIISRQLPFLEELILENALSISAKDHNDVQNLLPRCAIRFI